MVSVLNARVLVRPGLVFHLAAAVLVTVETPQQKSFRPWRAYTPPAWRRCVAACAAYRELYAQILCSDEYFVFKKYVLSLLLNYS